MLEPRHAFMHMYHMCNFDGRKCQWIHPIQKFDVQKLRASVLAVLLKTIEGKILTDC